MSTKTPTRSFEIVPGGAVAKLFALLATLTLNSEPTSVLIDGPAGTGKTLGILHFLLAYGEQYPGSRMVITRLQRKRIADTVLRSFEDKVVCDGYDREIFDKPVSEGPGRANRASYKFRNGSEIVIAGMDDPFKWRGLEADLIYVNEVNEFTQEGKFEEFFRALGRNKKGPAMVIADCNPDSDKHWLLRRVGRGQMIRFVSSFLDNPCSIPSHPDHEAFKAYVRGLASSLSGVRRQRLFEGKWCSAEGAVWPEWHDAIHLTDKFPRKEDIAWSFGAVDWGYSSVGTIQVYAVTTDNRIVLAEEHYRSHLAMSVPAGSAEDCWVSRAADIWDRWRDREFRVFVCDPARPEFIEMFNNFLGHKGHGKPRLAIEADNDRGHGIEAVRSMLVPDEDGKPALTVYNDRLYDHDPILAQSSAPTSVVDEIPSYVFRRVRVSDRVLEDPDPNCVDHGCDAMRYACIYAHHRDLRRVKRKIVHVDRKPLFEDYTPKPIDPKTIPAWKRVILE